MAELPGRCPVCGTDLRRLGWPESHEGCEVRRADLEEWVRTGGGRVAGLLRRNEERELDEELLLLYDDEEE